MSELVLSKDAVQKEGIDVKVTQGDIIEMLVSERIEEIETMYETLRDSGKKIIEALEAEWKEARIAHAKKVNVPKGFKLNLEHINKIDAKPGATLKVLRLDYSYQRNTVFYRSRSSNCHDNFEGKFSVKAYKEVDGVMFEGWIPFEFCFNHSEKLLKLLEENNKQIEAFVASLPEEGISEKELTRKIKNTFTKEFVKTMSPDFQKSLKKGFGFQA
jgi:hypothetical protein